MGGGKDNGLQKNRHTVCLVRAQPPVHRQLLDKLQLWTLQLDATRFWKK